MKLLSALALPTFMATLAAAIDGPLSGDEPSGTQVTIYNRPEFNGLRDSFEPDVECHTLPPWIVSVRIPADQGIYCQLFDNFQCAGDGEDVLLQTTPDIEFGLKYPGIICGYLD
ncbi:hypothetical protein BJY00DRAFT_316059 [Aspergillus carlsbadensis]|nr:hypothetical protein BJY00DRAFT_316059 [Aspergillus carlsbadensis]